MDLRIQTTRLTGAAWEVAVAGAFTLGASVVRLGIDPFVDDKHQYAAAYVAVAAMTWLAGWRAGAAGALACLGIWELFRPVGVLDTTLSHVGFAYIGYLAMATVIVSGGEWLRRENQEAIALAKQLRLADRRRSDFMAVLGHELRNPVASIAMGSRLLKSGRLAQPEAQGAIEMVERQTRHMSRLVGDLLDVARMETGKLSLHLERVDVFAVVQEAVGDVRSTFEAKGQTVVVTQRVPAGFVLADRLRLTQMVVNLVQNASKFSPGQARIDVAVCGGPESVEILVQDRGIGIPAGHLERIFEPFVQLRPSAGEGRGLGLGLPLTRELAQLHGGTVRACSEGPGKGARFTLTLPRPSTADPGPAASLDPPVSCPPAPFAPGAIATQRRVLVVDDNPDAAGALALLLRVKGHEAFTAGDGTQALQVATRERPDCVFVDVSLPGMSGLELAVRLRQLLGTKATLVTLTGWDGAEQERRAREAGCDAHLTKPLQPEALDEALALAPAALPGGAT